MAAAAYASTRFVAGSVRRIIMCRPFSSQEKWHYSEDDIASIVTHMQTLALLHDPSSHLEQVEYLKSAMKIAENLAQVNDDPSIQRFHNPAQLMNDGCLKQNKDESSDPEIFLQSELVQAPPIISKHY